MQLATLTCALVAALLTVAALVLDPRHLLRVGAAALLALAAALWGVRQLRAKGAATVEIGIRDGDVWLREEATDLEVREERGMCLCGAMVDNLPFRLQLRATLARLPPARRLPPRPRLCAVGANRHNRCTGTHWDQGPPK